MASRFQEGSVRAGTRHLFSRDAEYFRERRSWRCVGRRREEPAARRRATNGPLRRDASFCEGSAPSVTANPRRSSPYFIVSRVSSFTTWVEACDGSPCGLRRGVAVTGFGIRQNLAISTLQRRFIDTDEHLLARPPMQKSTLLFLGTTSRGACVAPMRARPASASSGPKGLRGHMGRLAPAVSLRTLLIASCRRRRGATSKSCSELGA